MTTKRLPPRPPGVGKRGPLPGAMQQPIPHGTDRGHRAHHRHGDLPVCDPCLEAHARAEACRRHGCDEEYICPGCGQEWRDRRACSAHTAQCPKVKRS